MPKSIYSLGVMPIEDAKLRVEERLQLQTARKSSSYWGGDYYQTHLPGGSRLMVFCNQEDDAVGDPIVEAFPVDHVVMTISAEDKEALMRDSVLIKSSFGDPQFTDDAACT